MKIFGDPNGQIELRAKQKYKVLSATHSQTAQSAEAIEYANCIFVEEFPVYDTKPSDG